MAAILTVANENGGMFRGHGTAFCNDGTMTLLHKLFHLPSSPAKVWITLHSRKSANRVPVKVVNFVGYPGLNVPRFDGTLSQPGFDKALEPYIGNTLWLQVEYKD